MDEIEPLEPLRGVQGGMTTVTPGGLVKHTVYIQTDTLDRLRKRAYYRRSSLSRLIRQAIDEFLGDESS